MYVLHYAPDNASLIVRLALDTLRVPYKTALVDRGAKAQRSPAYRALNPTGLIPVLETPMGPLHETGAILLWLTNRHGVVGPQAGDSQYGPWLTWLFFVANTLHPALRQMFYTHRFIAEDQTQALQAGLQPRIRDALGHLDQIAAQGGILGSGTGALDFYVAACLRWLALYPADASKNWFCLADSPSLAAMCKKLERTAACAKLIAAEGLGKHPFTQPVPPIPPEGSAT